MRGVLLAVLGMGSPDGSDLRVYELVRELERGNNLSPSGGSATGPSYGFGATSEGLLLGQAEVSGRAG
jgi:hypothetical protein